MDTLLIPADDVVQITVTAYLPLEVRRLAEALIGQGLASDVYTMPAGHLSRRWWDTQSDSADPDNTGGASTELRAYLVTIRTTIRLAEQVAQLASTILEQEYLDIMVLPVAGGDHTYLNAVREALDGRTPESSP